LPRADSGVLGAVVRGGPEASVAKSWPGDGQQGRQEGHLDRAVPSSRTGLEIRWGSRNGRPRRRCHAKAAGAEQPEDHVTADQACVTACDEGSQYTMLCDIVTISGHSAGLDTAGSQQASTNPTRRATAWARQDKKLRALSTELHRRLLLANLPATTGGHFQLSVSNVYG
jgi:hypothetical protein